MVRDAPWENVLDAVLKNHRLGREIEGSVMRIAPLSAFQAEFDQRAAIAEAGLRPRRIERVLCT